MNWKALPPAIEIGVASIAAACLGGAVGFAVARTAPFGAELAMASGVGALVAVAAWLFLSRIDSQRARKSFAPVDSLAGSFISEEAYPLDNSVDSEVLLLDDPLPTVDDESRVVRLFTAQPTATMESPPFAGPGEMIARIEDYLGQARGSAAAAAQAHPDRAAAEDASAALHAALADIRRSLRQG